MLRVLTVTLLCVVALGVAASFVLAPRFGLWFPRGVTTIAARVDALFDGIGWVIAIAFVLTQALLVLCVWRFARPSSAKARFTHGNTRLEVLWTAIPTATLVFIAFAQLSTWNAIRAQPGNAKPLARVDAFQFGWRFVHAGRDAQLDTADDVPASYELVVPRDEVVWLELASRDVIHSFFVPSFRLKQDVVPGMKIPISFEAREEGTFDLVCAELCGFGHYKMAGRVRVVSRADYDAWVGLREREIGSNGRDDAR